MRKTIILLLLLSFCSSGTDSTSDEPTQGASEELVPDEQNDNKSRIMIAFLIHLS